MLKATFGAGCFWHVEEVFRSVPGMISTSVGYMGGHFENPSYLDVCARITGHAEVTQLEYDPDQISYEQLLEIFWQIHDPTSVNRQGNDRGEQYRSVIFTHTPEQNQIAHRSRREQESSGRYDQPIVTQIEPASDYWLASEDHQHYFAKRGRRKPRSQARS